MDSLRCRGWAFFNSPLKLFMPFGNQAVLVQAFMDYVCWGTCITPCFRILTEWSPRKTKLSCFELSDEGHHLCARLAGSAPDSKRHSEAQRLSLPIQWSCAT